MAEQLERLFDEYDELAGDVARSKHEFFPGNLKRWLDFLDRSSPFARPILQQLESSADFKVWFAPYQLIAQGGGRKDIVWPPEQRKRLGTQLLLFRQFAGGGVDPKFFAFSLMRSGPNANDGTRDIVEQIFLPASRELRRFLESVAEPAPTVMIVPPVENTTEARVDLLTLKPAIWGMSIDLKELLRRCRSWWLKRQ